MTLTAILVAAALLSGSHDISTLPAWGPYSKQYSGISHIDDISSGTRVDFTVVPGFYRRSYIVPNVLFVSGCNPWKVSSDLSEITYRYELEWKDRVYVDVTYHVLDESKVLVGMHCVNTTALTQNLLLHDVASVHRDENLPQVRLDSNNPCTHAIDYLSYEPAVRKHNYALVYDGQMRGEKRDALSLCGSVVSTSGQAGDRLVCEAPCEGPLWMRWRAEKGVCVRLSVNGEELSLNGTGEYEFIATPASRDGKICVETLSDGVVRIDSFVGGSSPSIIPAAMKCRPELEVSEGSCTMDFEGVGKTYGICWNYPLTDVKQYADSELDLFMRKTVHQHPPKYFNGDGEGHFVSVFQRPVVVRANSDTTVYNLICCGDKAEIEAVRKAFKEDENSFRTAVRPAPAEMRADAEKYALGEQLMEATLLTNVVYPVYTQREFIRHFTPGKNWNSLYTWDSGFITLALGCMDPEKAFENLRAYTTEPGCQSAFIHHGTPLPTQFLALEELIGKGIGKEEIAFLYPRFKQYYDFLCGHNEASTTMMKSGLVRTWDYFYNSGGWDDYPPQHYMRSHPDLYEGIAPMVSSSFCIRAAKIMRMVASMLSLKKDVKLYDADIKKMGEAVLKYGWDAQCGYFGYVTHDADGNPDGFFRHEDGSNYNKGLDGVMPLMAGICPQEIRDVLVSNIFSPEKLWTGCGISTVDQSASYYLTDGYWNGDVWMPHQWVIWKSMLDYNLTEEADRIAMTALNNWNRECSETYQCCEHFVISSGRGAGWHNFSGLSSPVVNWYKAYFCPGTATAGFDTLISDASFTEGNTSFGATLSFDKDAVGRDVTLMVCLAPGHGYRAVVGKKDVRVEKVADGLVRVRVKATSKAQKINIGIE